MIDYYLLTQLGTRVECTTDLKCLYRRLGDRRLTFVSLDHHYVRDSAMRGSYYQYDKSSNVLMEELLDKVSASE